MSVSALSWAFSRPMADPSAKAVLLALADHADEDGCCWPSNQRLQLFTAYAERAIREAVKRLEGSGALRCERREGKSTVYHLNLKWTGDNPATTCTPALNAPGTKRLTTPALDDTTPASGAPTPAANAPEPSRTPIEPSSEPSVARVARNGHTKAQRIPDDWSVTDPLREWAGREVPELDVDRENLRFIDYWRGAPGSRGRKADWQATWRNWMRRSAEQHLARGDPETTARQAMKNFDYSQFDKPPR